MNNIQAIRVLATNLGKDTDLNSAIKVAIISLATEEPKEEPAPQVEIAKPKGRPRYDWAKAEACFKAGWSTKKIADELGCTEQSVKNHFKGAKK